MLQRAAQPWLRFTLVLFVTLVAGRVSRALPAFPGAEGFGAAATGGRGGEVFHVSNLLGTNTGTYEGPNGYNRGTLRWCLTSEASTLPRTIVFDVSGHVTLASQITLENSNITLAGQTAPEQGVTSAGKPWLMESGNNLVIRYIRNRLGRNGGQDSMGVEGGSNMIFDHVTSTWSNDEALSVAKDGTLVTVQNSLIYEGLNHSGHGYGSLIRPEVDSKVTYHHNLYANNQSRNPRPGTYNSKTLDFDFRNNVIYNWGLSAGYSGGSEEGNPEHVKMNYVGNYVIAGPSTYDHENLAFHTEVNAALQAYQFGNRIDSNGPAAFPDEPDGTGVYNGIDNGWGMFAVEAGSLTQAVDPFPLAPVPVTTQSADDAYNSVMDFAGSFWWNRDSADARVIDQVETNTGEIIDHQDDVGGFPTLPTFTRTINTWDSDYDGMPNTWETDRGLNPNLSTDRNGDFDADGYTNLEEYINETGAWPAPRAITWAGGNGRFALNQNWDTWQPSQYDEVRVNSGTVTVDAIGQRAGTVRLGTNSGENAILSITGGWLKVTDEVNGSGNGEVVIGAHPSATAALNLSGGVLDAKTLSKGAGGLFNFTGGTLHADTVEFDLTNNGGTLAPGHSVGQTHVVGDLTLASGTLQIELASVLSADSLLVDDVATLGGALSVLPLGTFSPQSGQSWKILTADSLINNFASITPGYHVQKQGDELWLFVGDAPVAAGDFNDDGVVDAADYTVWRNHLGESDEANLNFNGDGGEVGESDYQVWTAHYGESYSPAGSAGLAQSLPEPTAIVLFLTAAAWTCCGYRDAKIRS